MIQTIIIGKNSNLSRVLKNNISNCISISSREIGENINILNEYKEKKINLIFNNFQPATELNNLKNVQNYISNAIMVTSMVLDYFKNTNINKIIYTSSSSVYGNNILCQESDDLKPMNLHASLKVANEKLIEKYCIDNDIDYTITRIFNMFGGNDEFSVVSKMIKAYRTNEILTIVNNGNAIRDFIHIDDVVMIYKKLLDINNVKILNIGTCSGNSIKGILDFLSHNDIKIEIQNILRDELKISTSDARLLNKIIGEYNFFGIEEYLTIELAL
jgi:UDP-glucose 4-epimerase